MPTSGVSQCLMWQMAHAWQLHDVAVTLACFSNVSRWSRTTPNSFMCHLRSLSQTSLLTCKDWALRDGWWLIPIAVSDRNSTVLGVKSTGLSMELRWWTEYTFELILAKKTLEIKGWHETQSFALFKMDVIYIFVLSLSHKFTFNAWFFVSILWVSSKDEELNRIHASSVAL